MAASRRPPARSRPCGPRAPRELNRRTLGLGRHQPLTERQHGPAACGTHAFEQRPIATPSPNYFLGWARRGAPTAAPLGTRGWCSPSVRARLRHGAGPCRPAQDQWQGRSAQGAICAAPPRFWSSFRAHCHTRHRRERCRREASRTDAASGPDWSQLSTRSAPALSFWWVQGGSRLPTTRRLPTRVVK
jgi:hypothetical protein